MSDHTIIDTSRMEENNKFSFKQLSGAQKIGIAAGGVALTGAIAGIVTSLVSSDAPSMDEQAIAGDIQEVNVESAEEATSADVTEEEVSTQAYDEVEEVVDSSDYIEENMYDVTFDTEIDFSDAVDNGMSFEEAFSSARADVGSGGWFNWHAQSYSTFTEEEWLSLSEEEQVSFINQVVSQSDIQNAEWVDSVVEAEVPEEIVIDDEEVELYIDEEVSEPEILEMEEEINETMDDSTSEDLSEDIIIVKPIRGADMNADGIVDAIVVDYDNDGNIDLVAMDEDHDGKFESFMINEDGDDDLDVFIIDEGGDGIDDSDTMEEISDVVNMEDFVILDEDEVPEDLSFIDDIFGDDDVAEDENLDQDLGFDEPGL